MMVIIISFAIFYTSKTSPPLSKDCHKKFETGLLCQPIQHVYEKHVHTALFQVLSFFFFKLFAQKLLIVVTKGIGNMKKIVIMVGITTSSNKTPVNIGSALGHVRT